MATPNGNVIVKIERSNGTLQDITSFVSTRRDTIYSTGETYTAARMNSYIRSDFKGYFDTACEYCGTRGGEDKYHPGTCANCGATLK